MSSTLRILVLCLLVTHGQCWGKDLEKELERRVARLAPDDERGALTLARWCRKNGLYEEEQQLLQQAAERMPESEDLRSTLEGMLQRATRHRNVKTPWRVTVDHFDIRSNTSEAMVHRFAAAISAFYRHFSSIIRIAKPPMAVWGTRVRVWIFNSRVEFNAHRESTGGRLDESTVGYYSLERKELVLYNDLDDPRETQDTLFHETTHLLLHLALGSRFSRVPNWLHEGLAEYFAASVYDPRKAEFESGRPQYRRLVRCRLLLQGEGLPSLGHLRQDAVEDSLAFYAASWAVVHMLLEERNHRHRRKFAKYFNKLAEGRWSDFDKTFRRPEERLAEYIQAFELPPRWEAELLLAKDQTEAAARLLAQHAREAPNDPLAHRELGTALFQLDRLPEAEAAFRRSLELQADFPSAQVQLGLTLLFSEGRKAEALPHLERAVALDPTGVNTYYLALGRWSLGDLEGAGRNLAEAEQRGAPPDRVQGLRTKLQTQATTASSEQ